MKASLAARNEQNWWYLFFREVVDAFIICTQEPPPSAFPFRQVTLMMDSASEADFLKRGKHSASPSSTRTEASSVPFFLDGKAEAYVGAGSLVFFSPRLNGQLKQDVIYSSLLAQLAANKKHNRFNETDDWYTFYNKIMTQLGWITRGFEFHKYEHRSNFLTISQVAQELLGGLIGDKKELMTTVKETFDSLTKASDVFTLFGSNSIAKHGGNFQIFVCDVDSTNKISVMVLFFYFYANEGFEDLFFTSQKKQETAVFISTTNLSLNEEHFAGLRNEVKDKLGERAFKLVQKVATCKLS